MADIRAEGRHTSSTKHSNGALNGIVHTKHLLKRFLVPLPGPSVNLKRLPLPIPNCRYDSESSLPPPS
jgi:hypothetical protein